MLLPCSPALKMGLSLPSEGSRERPPTIARPCRPPGRMRRGTREGEEPPYRPREKCLTAEPMGSRPHHARLGRPLACRRIMLEFYHADRDLQSQSPALNPSGHPSSEHLNLERARDARDGVFTLRTLDHGANLMKHPQAIMKSAPGGDVWRRRRLQARHHKPPLRGE